MSIYQVSWSYNVGEGWATAYCEAPSGASQEEVLEVFFSDDGFRLWDADIDGSLKHDDWWGDMSSDDPEVQLSNYQSWADLVEIKTEQAQKNKDKEGAR